MTHLILQNELTKSNHSNQRQDFGCQEMPEMFGWVALMASESSYWWIAHTHWTYECKQEPKYLFRPSRSKQLKSGKTANKQQEERVEVETSVMDRRGIANEILKKRKVQEQPSSSDSSSDSD